MILYGRRIYQTEYDMAMSTMFSYPPSQYVLPHWKCVLHCCAKFICIALPSQELDNHDSNKRPTISFHVYNLFSHYMVHGKPTPGKKYNLLLLFECFRPCAKLKNIYNKRACNYRDIY